MDLRSRISQGISGYAFSRGAYLLCQIVVVPLLVAGWGKLIYGEWLSLTAFAAYLTYSSFGLAQSLRTHMATAHAAGRSEDVASSYITGLVFVVVVAGIIGCLSLVAMSAVDGYALLNIATLSKEECATIALCLLGQVVFSLLSGINAAALGAVGRYGVAAWLDGARQLTELLLIGSGVLAFHTGPLQIAEVLSATSIAGFLCSLSAVRMLTPRMLAGPPRVRLNIIRALWKPMLGAFALTIGYTGLSVQAPRLILAAVIGPGAVAEFSVAVMLMRFVRIVVEVPSFASTVEMAMAQGRKDIAGALRIFVTTSRVTIWLALALLPAVVMFGPSIISLWTAGRIDPSRWLIFVLAIGTLAFSAGLPAQEGLMSANRLMSATGWLALASVPFCALCYLMSRLWGPLGTAGAGALLDFIFALLMTVQCVALFNTSFGKYGRSLSPPIRMLADELRGLVRRRDSIS